MQKCTRSMYIKCFSFVIHSNKVFRAPPFRDLIKFYKIINLAKYRDVKFFLIINQ